MAWDSSRPVPWQRLVREWLIYVGIMAVIFFLLFRDDDGLIGIFAGLLVSGPLYLGVGFVLAKFGYQRKSFRELRSDRESIRASRSSSSSDDGSGSSSGGASRPKPPPTKRTSGGHNRPTSKQKRR
ncbi:MAG: hypothetical protein AAGD33_24010 [Actinomycetota bacterium]